MVQLIKLVLILVIMVFVAAVTAFAVSWLVLTLVATAPAWLCGGLVSSSMALRRLARHGPASLGLDADGGERPPALAAAMGPIAGAAATIVVIAFQGRDSPSTPFGDYMVGVSASLFVASRAAPLLERWRRWRAERGRRGSREPAPDCAEPRACDDSLRWPRGLDEAYAILQVDRGAPLESVKSQYKKLVKDYHPDHSQQATPAVRLLAEERLREINWAFETVMRRQ